VITLSYSMVWRGPSDTGWVSTAVKATIWELVGVAVR
jgi:hypothetical protein